LQLLLHVKHENQERKEKVYTASFASGYHFRKVNEFDETIDYADISVKEMDTLIGFVCDVFDNQFTIDEFYEGIPSHQVISTITDVFVYVRTGKTPEELEKERNERAEGNESGK
jgi:hypothetical protein